MSLPSGQVEAVLTWMHWIRLRALAFIVGIGLAAVATISLTAWPVWPVIGVAVAVAAAAVNTITARLGGPVCLGCGRDLTGQPSGTYGVACGHCGAITQERGERRPRPRDGNEQSLRA